MFRTQPKTVADLLDRACKPSARLGASGASVYALGQDDSAFAPYALRIAGPQPRSFRSKLMRSSSLTTPRSLATGIAVGQPLMESAEPTLNISILRREPGLPIKRLQDDLPPTDYAALGMRVMEPLLARAEAGDNPLEPILAQCYKLLREGYRPDIHWGNVLYDRDAQCLRLVDQLAQRQMPLGHKAAMNALSDTCWHLREVLTQRMKYGVHAHKHAVPAGYDDACRQLDRVLDEACRQTDAHFAALPHAPIFQQVAQVKIGLSEKPAALEKALRQLHQQLSLPARA